jgi:hypothetical protein
VLTLLCSVEANHRKKKIEYWETCSAKTTSKLSQIKERQDNLNSLEKAFQSALGTLQEVQY